MKRKSKFRSRAKSGKASRNQNLLILLFAALVALILLLRMAVFVAGHARHHF
jgi:hypothetical protein